VKQRQQRVLQDALLLQFQALAPLSLIAVQSRNMMVSGFWRGPSSSVGILVVAGNLGIGSSDHPRMALQGRRHALALSDRCLGGFYATSGGKIMLAHMPDALRQKYLAKVEFEAETKNTISSIKSCDIGSVRQGKANRDRLLLKSSRRELLDWPRPVCPKAASRLVQ
jgi:hypothetical protein